MTTENVVLEAHRRGSEFKYSSVLENGWTVDMFTGGILFTVRKRIPASSVVNDRDPDVVAQASIATGGGIVFSTSTAFTVTIPGVFNAAWPTEKLYWDMRGFITAVPHKRVLDIAAGTVEVRGDVTRTR